MRTDQVKPGHLQLLLLSSASLCFIERGLFSLNSELYLLIWLVHLQALTGSKGTCDPVHMRSLTGARAARILKTEL